MSDLREPEPADAVALVRAHLDGDEVAVYTILAMVDEHALFAMTTGVLLQLLTAVLPGGVDELDDRLRQWQIDRVLT